MEKRGFGEGEGEEDGEELLAESAGHACICFLEGGEDEEEAVVVRGWWRWRRSERLVWSGGCVSMMDDGFVCGRVTRSVREFVSRC